MTNAILPASERAREGVVRLILGYTDDDQPPTVEACADAILALLDERRILADQAPPGVGLWRERWYGSDPQKGSAIVDERGNLIAYLGGDEATHAITTAVVRAHNETLSHACPSVAGLPDGVPWFREALDNGDLREAVRRLSMVAQSTREVVLKQPPERHAQCFAGLLMACDAMMAALSTPAPAVGDAPEGWVLVPKDAWQQMLNAACDYYKRLGGEQRFPLPATFRWHEVWDIMLAAAPSAPATGGEEGR